MAFRLACWLLRMCDKTSARNKCKNASTNKANKLEINSYSASLTQICLYQGFAERYRYWVNIVKVEADQLIEQIEGANSLNSIHHCRCRSSLGRNKQGFTTC